MPELQSRVSLPKHYQNESLKSESATNESRSTFNSGISKPAVNASSQTNFSAGASATASNAPVIAAPISPAPVTAPPTLERPIVEWFPIPAPMAGVWTKRGDLTTSVTDLRTGLSEALNQWTDDEMTVTWGHQTDKLGNIWHANILPAERDGNSIGKVVKFLTVGQKLEASSAGALVTRTHYLVSERYGVNGPVADVFQQEALNHYQLIAESQLQNNSTNRVFAYQGQPIRDGSLLTNFNRVGAFNPTPSLSGIDLVQSLNDYLRSIGRIDLMR